MHWFGVDLTTKKPEAQPTKEPEMQQSKELSSLSYIESAVMERVKPDTEPRQEDMERASTEGRSLVAGFALRDPDKEKAVLDRIVTKRNESILRFLSDREEVRASLGRLGITPLAVVPRAAWADICRKSGLIVMWPNDKGEVAISRAVLSCYSSAERVEAAAKHHYAAFVRALFSTAGETLVKIVLPTPPAEVAATLLKAKGVSLYVAAVPEAIRFVQTPTELYKAATINPKDEWARRQGYADYADWVKRDPIVFYEHGSASAIIAQFGEFPIEKEVVDRVIAGDKLIPEDPGQAIIQGMVNQRSEIQANYQFLLNQAMQVNQGIMNPIRNARL